MATIGGTEPTVNAIADEVAACHGFVSSSGSMPSSASTCAANGP